MLGDLRQDGAAIWFRTAKPETATYRLTSNGGEVQAGNIETQQVNDNTYTIRFSGLQGQEKYHYEIESGQQSITGAFTTRASQGIEETKIVFGSCYNQAGLEKEGGRIFASMLAQKPDAVIFMGDMPYVRKGRLDELREGHRLFRENENFVRLTSTTPVYAATT